MSEFSFVVLGADENTSAQIAASADQSNETADMDFTKWLESQGFTADALSEQQTKNLAGDLRRPGPQASGRSRAEPAATIRAEAAAEAKRIAAIRKVCGGEHPHVEAKAIEEGWDATRADLEVLRASRPQGPAIHTTNGKPAHGRGHRSRLVPVGADARREGPAVVRPADCRSRPVPRPARHGPARAALSGDPCRRRSRPSGPDER